MKYVGSKNRISKFIVPILQDAIDRNHIQTYVEPFIGGGGNVIDKISCRNRVGYDSNKYLVAFWNALLAGWDPSVVSMTEALYRDIKDHKDSYPPEMVALAGFCATYNAKWFGGYAGIVKTKIGTTRNYYDEAVRNVMKQIPLMAGVKVAAQEFDSVQCEGCLIYCDPPYEGTTKYQGEFDHSRYWEWVRNASRKNIVICSEYRAPEDFVCIWQKETTTTLDKASRSKAVEKLFVLKQSEGGKWKKYLQS